MQTKSGRYLNREAAIKAYDADRMIYRVITTGTFEGFYTKREATRLAKLVGGEVAPVDPRAWA